MYVCITICTVYRVYIYICLYICMYITMYVDCILAVSFTGTDRNSYQDFIQLGAFALVFTRIV